MLIDRVVHYWYWSGRNSKTYVEITFWYDAESLERKETKRTHSCCRSDDRDRPEWAKIPMGYNESLSVWG